MFGNSENRFETIYKEGAVKGFKIIVDRETGVHYLCNWDGYTGGITPLLGKDGKPVISSTNN
ncbi:MAG TPA: DUF6440 family protein [Lachnospiraceae bacterium]|nr:DUF6440 family protein [Lachnospiraceae bacterium]